MPEEENGEEDEEEEKEDEELCEEEGHSGQERQRHHEEWLERERLAQEAFRLRSERAEAARKRQEDEERRIKEEWDLQQKKEEEEKEHKQQEKKNREEAVQKMLDQAETQLSNPGPWMNPEDPKAGNSENYGTERDVQNCPFFLKTGACRFGDRCSRKHAYPTSSSTLMIRGMFVTFGMDQCHRDDYDTDASLEHSEEDLREHFLEFYHDVLPEFQSLGRVVQFKVSCNFEPHLRGNVYVQFDTEEHCLEAYQKFNGRWYAGKQLHCELCPVTRWKNAICGLFNKLKCPKGKHCNFLHVFRNPGNEFWEADRDLSPDRTRDGSHRGGWHSERWGDRSWRHRHGSRSPTRSERSRRGSERKRSHSRERADSHRRGESLRSESQSSRWRPASSRRERCRSRSGDRERDRLRNRSQDRERDGHRSRERDRSPDGSQNGDTRRGRSRSGSKEREMRPKRERSNYRSPEKPKHEDGEGGDTRSDDGNPAHRRRKHSKKSKKKSKKKLKKKKKSRSAEAISSSGESENQDHPDVEVKEEASYLESSFDVQEVLSVKLSSNPCVESQNTAEVKSVLEETTESTHPELPSHQEEVDDGTDIKPQL
ncbi:U2 small nuclear ribonucleoprotein auxiliary factor subunit-related protein 2 [Merluccius polli]|uniref:U2 small nuclear ribonucleoprotein auxiliary factor subunit-related protein 2 n=1 Tax=Merluccius polli TaxID=89951 RepID=A0AA47P752_MERPO|nr:U2 small nuclear ribonucleoprotein auxiliary factor subunit-related protein 2 [Merluccius polli]